VGIEGQIIVKALNLPLLACGAIVFAFAGIVALWMKNSYRGYNALERLEKTGGGLRAAVVILALVYFGVYTWLSVHRYNKLMLGSWDLGIFASLLSNALDGRLFTDYRGPFDHFSPAVYLLAPLWAVWRDGRLLLVVETALLAAAAWPLYLLAKETSRSVLYAALAGILYLLYPLLGAGNLYDFHAVAFSPVFFFSMLLFMKRGRWRLYALFAVMLLLVKEGEAVLVFGTGLYLFLTGRRRRGALTMGLAAVWTAALLFIIMPAITGEPFRHFSRYDPAAAEAVPAAARAAQAVGLMIYTLLPISFLAARRWRPLVSLFIPAVAVNFFSASTYQWVLFGHYGLTVASAALGAAALSLPAAKDREDRDPSALPVFALVAALLCNVLFSYPAHRRWAKPAEYLRMEDSFNVLSMPLPLTRQRCRFYRIEAHDAVFTTAVAYFPPNARIAAQNNLGYFFAGKQPLFDLSPQVEADFYLFDMKKNYDIRAETYDALFERFRQDPDVICFMRLASRSGVDFLFFCRGRAWVDFYENALADSRRSPEKIEAQVIVSAVEDTLGLPATYPMVMEHVTSRPPETGGLAPE